MGTGTKEKKSFKKFARKHLATVIENRRKGRDVKKEKMERIEARKRKEEKAARKEEDEHQAQINALKDSDPQFYSYLEEEDPNLLQFGQEDVDPMDELSGSDVDTEADDEEDMDDGELEEALEALDEESEDEDEDADEDDKVNARTVKRIGKRVSAEEVEKLVSSKNLADAIDILISAMRELGYTVREKATEATERKFDEPSLVKSSVIQISKLAAASLPSMLVSKGGQSTFKSQKSRSMVKRLVNGILSAVSEGSNDGGMAASLLQVLSSLVPALFLLKGLTKITLRAALKLCTHDEEATRVAAYMVVRSVATRSAGVNSMYQSAALKGMFVALVRAGHTYTARNIETIAFLMNCVVDLYGADMEAAYQHAFVYIRQLAIYLRAALQQQSQANVRAVFNWQFLISLRTWGLVVSTYSDPNQLGPLIHPVIQIAMGMMDLFCSPRMFPMHLHVIEMMNHMASRAGVYIPVSTYLLRIITSPTMTLDVSRKRGANEEESTDLRFTMRIKKAQAKSQQYRGEIWIEAMYLLTEHLAAHSHAIGFPEAFWATAATLRKLKKEVKLPKVHAAVSTLLKHMESTSQKISSKRDQVNFGPCDTISVKQFEDDMKRNGNPVASYYNSQRQTRMNAFASKQRGLQDRVVLDDVADRQPDKRKRKEKRH